MIKKIASVLAIGLLAAGVHGSCSTAASAAPKPGAPVYMPPPTGIKTEPMKVTAEQSKRNLEQAKYKGQPRKGASTNFAACPGNLCYVYNDRDQSLGTPTTATGARIDATVHKPVVRAWDYHSLAELNVRGPGGGNIVEAGWNVDRGLYGDDNPHLFVFWWLNGVGKGYNTLDFVLASGFAITPGDSVLSAVGTTKNFHWEHFTSACGCMPGWWLSYNNAWVGGYPDTLWSGNFTSPEYIAVYGELAMYQTPTQSQIGNGHNATATQGASFTNLSLLGTGAPAAGFNVADTVTDPTRWPQYDNSSTSFHYGGPGGNDGIKSTTTPSANDCGSQGVGTDPTGWGAVCFYDNSVSGVPTIKRAQFDGGTGTACRANYGTADGGPPGTNPIRVVATVPYQRVQVYLSANCTGTNMQLGGGVSTLNATYSAKPHLSFKMTTVTAGCAAGYPTVRPTC